VDFEAFDREFLDPSPRRDMDGLWPSSPPAATAAQPSDDSLDEGSGDDDNASPGELGDDCSEGGFGDEEHVLVASDQYSWKIDHAKGDHKFKGACMYGLAKGD
jgi:hypothetical protein